jgi:hypothetical protein
MHSTTHSTTYATAYTTACPTAYATANIMHRISAQIGSQQAFPLGIKHFQWRRNVEVLLRVIEMPQMPAAMSLRNVAVVAVHRVAIMEATQ